MTQDRYSILFEPVKIGPVTAPNRFYAVPHATGHGWHQPHGANALRAMKAEGGWGTVAVQMTEIASNTDMANHPMERIWDDGDIPRHAAQVEAIQKHGSLSAIELAHGGMRARNYITGLPVIGPSSFPILRPEVPLQTMEMDLADIKKFREAHKAAARRAKAAGYDILYVYAAHDLSILSHFLSAKTNKRTDAYGGSFENRLRLLREVLEDTFEVAKNDCAVALRFSVAEPGKAGGLASDGEGRDVVEALSELPDLWDVNISGWSKDSATARFYQEGFQLPYMDFVKSVTSKPVVGVGRYTSPDLMVSLVKKGVLDLIGAARPSIADPFLPNKIKEGRIEDIRECIGCNICVSMDSYGVPVRCTQNPTISEEWRKGWHPESPVLSKALQSHLIVGAGPSGLECAVTLQRAGHQVTLVDSKDQAGGRITRESALTGLASWSRVRDYRLYQLSQSANADLYLSSHLSAADAIEFGADNIIVATGAKWRKDGVGSSNFEPFDFGGLDVFSPDDIMSGKAQNVRPSKFIVYDDDHFYMASALAETLRHAGHDVVYVTPLPNIATWTDHTLDQNNIICRLNELGVRMLPNVMMSNDAVFTNTLDGSVQEFGDFKFVFVGARETETNIYDELKASFKTATIYKSGDCVVPGTIQAAVYSGHRLARTILSGEDEEANFKREQTLLEF